MKNFLSYQISKFKKSFFKKYESLLTWLLKKALNVNIFSKFFAVAHYTLLPKDMKNFLSTLLINKNYTYLKTNGVYLRNKFLTFAMYFKYKNSPNEKHYTEYYFDISGNGEYKNMVRKSIYNHLFNEYSNYKLSRNIENNVEHFSFESKNKF